MFFEAIIVLAINEMKFINYFFFSYDLSLGMASMKQFAVSRTDCKLSEQNFTCSLSQSENIWRMRKCSLSMGNKRAFIGSAATNKCPSTSVCTNNNSRFHVCNLNYIVLQILTPRSQIETSLFV